jgi:dTDP-4-dehydrorhamnose reductase
MKILVTGANGQLGSEMRLLSLNYNTFEWVFMDKKKLNLADLINLESKLEIISPTVIINSAAYTNVEKAEHERKISNIVNNHAVSIIAKWSFDNNVKLIHFSSDYVYPGNTTNSLKESDITNPVNYYGITKLLGEKKCLSNNPNSMVIRTSGNFSIYGNNFVKTMLKKMKDEKKINVVKNQIFSPTYVKDLVLVIMSILSNKNWVPGIYNYSNLGKTSWYKFAIDIRSIGGFECSINPVSLLDFNSDVKRPKYTLLDKNKIIKTFSISIPHYKLGLEKCIKNIINEE